MIGKIDPKIHIQLETFPLSETRGVANFHDLLAEKLDVPKPLPRWVLDVLNQMIEKTLSEFGPEKEDSLFLSSLSLESPAFPSLQGNLFPERSDLRGNKADSRPEGHRDYGPLIQEASRRYQVDPALIRAVIQAESGGNPAAVSSSGAQGLMQLMPATAADLGVKDAFDPRQNIMAGTSYLRQLLDRYHGEVKLALAAYNWGLGNLERRPEAMPGETKDYITKVERYYRSSPKPSQTV